MARPPDGLRPVRREAALGPVGGIAAALAFAAILLAPIAAPFTSPEALAADTDLTVTGDAAYTVLPEKGLVHVVVDLDVHNRTAETKTRKFYFDRAYLAVMPGTKAYKVAGWKGSHVAATKQAKTYTMLRIDFGSRLYSGQSKTLQLSFDLPDPGSTPNREVRVGASLVTFPVWAFATDGAKGGSVTVRFPRGYDVSVEAGEFAETRTDPDGTTVLDSGQLAAPLSFFAFVAGQQPATYLDTPLEVTAGDEAIHLALRAWADDPGWSGRVAPVLAGALPVLRRETGLPWPYVDTVVVAEAVSRSAGGYAGRFDAAAGQIEVAYWASQLVILHEAAHAWFNGGLVADRWASDGFASLYAARAAAELKVKGASPEITDALAAVAYPLNAWGLDLAPASPEESYGYAASLALARLIAERAGDEPLREVWAAASAGVGAYQPVIEGGAGVPVPEPELVAAAPDWRGLLDLLDDTTGRGFSDLWRTWVVRPDEVALLDARAESRDDYRRTLDMAGGWVLPRQLRDALRAWQFDAADKVAADARTVLVQRKALEGMASRQGLVLPSTMQTLFEAGSLAEASAEAEAERNAMVAIGQAQAARAQEQDLLTAIGMIGEDPDADLGAAGRALAAGDLDLALARSDRAYRAWTEAWQEGRRRLLVALAALATAVVIGTAIGGRVRQARLRPPVVAVFLAVSLVAGGSVLPPIAAPVAPLLGILGAPVVRAADDIEITTAARYVVDPAAAVVRVTVDVTAVNRKPDATGGGTVTRYFYDGVNLGVQDEATGFAATRDGAPLRVTSSARDGYRLVTVLFGTALYYQQTAKITLRFTLPAAEPRSESDTRVGRAFATFLAWAFGDTGTVRVEVPAGFVVDASGSTLERRTASDGGTLLSGSAERPLDWYAWINARDDTALATEQVDLVGGDRVLVRGWPEDPVWRSRVADRLRAAVPELVARIGLPWPVDGPLTVIEMHTPLLEGYAGFYDVAADEITISEDLDDETIVHEASHAWFNAALFTDRWVNEGLADEYAARVLASLGGSAGKPAAVTPSAAAAFALADWPPPAPIRDDVSDARERYGYAAAWTVMRAVVAEAGEPGMQAVFRAAAAGTTAYPAGAAAPEPATIPGDWRRFLDLVQGVGGADGAASLVATWVAGPDDQAALAARETARTAYASLVADGTGWAAPVLVRMALDGWRFDDAGKAIAAAAAILDQRDAMGNLAASAGLVPPSDLEAVYETAASGSDLAAAAARSEAQVATLEDVLGAGAAVAAPRDLFTSLGLDETAAARDIAAARAGWQAGDLEAAEVAVEAVGAALAAAPDTGRTRVLLGGGGTVGLVIVVGVAALVRRRRRGPDATALTTETVDRYATLPASGSPDAVAGAPRGPHDEGADQS